MPEDRRGTLFNAVRQAVATLTAVEIDTEQDARELIDTLIGELGPRPNSLIEMKCRDEEEARCLLKKAGEETADWPPEQGVLFFLDLPDKTVPEQTEQTIEGRIAFWKAMNLQREGWGALDCHVIFFLLTGEHGSFNLLLTVADHLADWVPLKLPRLGNAHSASRGLSQSEMPTLLSGRISPEVARDRLKILERRLETELAEDRPDSRILVQRYYLPMLEMALALDDLNYSKALRARVEEGDRIPIPESYRPKWWTMSFSLDLRLRNLAAAEEIARTMLDWASSHKVLSLQGRAFHYLGMIAQEQRDFTSAENWYRKSLAIEEKQGHEYGAALTYHQLGMIAQEQRDFASAENWYRKSLAIKEKQGHEYGAAGTYHQLGMIAQEQRDFASAENWYRKSLAIKEKQGHEYGAAGTYHQLGMIAQEQRDFASAENWYRKSLAITEKQDHEYGAAGTYHQLGMIAQEQRDFASAENWYRKSLAIEEKQGDEYGAAGTYHQLGMIAQEQRDFASAENWYRKSLATTEKQGDEYGAAITYHQLGMIAQEQRDFASAENWYRKSLAIKEKQGHEYGAALTNSQLGVMSRTLGDFEIAGGLFLTGIEKFIACSDSYMANNAMDEFQETMKQAPEQIREKLRRLCIERGLEEVLHSSEEDSG